MNSGLQEYKGFLHGVLEDLYHCSNVLFLEYNKASFFNSLFT